jgi:hypothetical protein
MRINWEVVVKPSLWTGAGGVVVGMLLLSYGFGFMSRNTAEKLASTSSERAVIAVLAPVCADKFRALPDVAARTATLVADKDNSYKIREAFPEAVITLPGKSYPDSDLAAACAGLILAPPRLRTSNSSRRKPAPTMTTCGGTAFELWTDEMAQSITPNPSIYRSHDRRKRAEKKYASFDDYRMDC